MADVVDWDGNEVLTFGANGVAKLVDGVSKQPRYIIEVLPEMMAPLGGSVGSRSGNTPYRISVMAYGRQENTRIMLQSMFYKPKNR
jgi:Tfp pilus assembly protein PilX